MTFTVVTWNVLWRDRPARFQLLIEHLRQVDADIVMLQETSQGHAQAVAEELGLTLAAVAREDGPEASVPALMTRRTFSDVSVAALPRPSGNHAHYAASATIDVEGLRVRATATHLRHTTLAGRMGTDPAYHRAASGLGSVSAIEDPELRESVEIRLAQLAFIEATPVGEEAAQVMAGDMNFVPAGPEHRYLIDRGWTDAWRAAPRLGSGATILDRNPLIADGRAPYADTAARELVASTRHLDYTLDFQFARGPLEIGRSWTVGEPDPGGTSWPSDHLGLVVEYETAIDSDG